MAGKREVGARIRSARVERGWKQKHLAAQVEVEPTTVSRWERGATTPDLDVLGLVAEATGRPLSYFLDNGLGVAQDAGLPDAVARIEAAAERIATESEKIAEMLESIRAELARSR